MNAVINIILILIGLYFIGFQYGDWNLAFGIFAFAVYSRKDYK